VASLVDHRSASVYDPVLVLVFGLVLALVFLVQDDSLVSVYDLALDVEYTLVLESLAVSFPLVLAS